MPRRLTLALLRLALRITTPRTRPWAEAMAAEAGHIEGNWATSMWALGSSTVLLKRAVTDRFARLEEDLMQRPRVLFSVGLTLLLLATFAVVLIAPATYKTYSRYRSANGTIVKMEPRTLQTPGGPAYYAVIAHVQFQYGGATYTRPIWLLNMCRQPRSRDECLRRYVVGQPYSFMFDRYYAPDKPAGLVYPPGVHQIRIVFLACLGFLAISAGMVYVGKKKAV